MAARLLQIPGHQTLNGPIIDGYASLARLDDGTDLLIVASGITAAEAVAHYLGQHPGPRGSQAAHVYVGQPQWSVNVTKACTLQDLLSAPGRRRIVLP